MRLTHFRGPAALTAAALPATLLLAALAMPAWAQSTGAEPDASPSTPPTATAAEPAGDSTADGAASDSAASDGAADATTGDASDPAAEPAAASDDSGAAATADDPGYAMGDIVLGDAEAPVTVIEYASFTCPHCGSFAEETFPQVREEYIETGKVKFILREVYFDQYGLWASMVARCGGEKGFYPLSETFLTTQSTWTRAEDIGHAIQQVGRRAGLSADRLEQCLSDRAYAEDLLARYQEHMAADQIQSTPTFIINGEKHVGAIGFEEFSEIVDAAL